MHKMKWITATKYNKNNKIVDKATNGTTITHT